METRSVITGQSVSRVKFDKSKELRRDMTPEEILLWSRLRGNQLGGLHFRRQQIIDGFIVDFYCHKERLVVEVDGPVHDSQSSYDGERDEILKARGLRVLRIRADEVRSDVDHALARVLAAARTNGDSPPL
jgi:very-short-patch-repair endonuclease